MTTENRCFQTFGSKTLSMDKRFWMFLNKRWFSIRNCKARGNKNILILGVTPLTTQELYEHFSCLLNWKHSIAKLPVI